MAERFDMKSVYEDETWIVKYDNAEGYQEKFFDLVQKELESSNFPNLSVSVDEYITGGLIFNKEQTKMLKIKATKSNFKLFEIFYRVQIFGNVVLYTRMECMERGFFSSITGKTGKELKALIRLQCANMAQYEEFVAIDKLANIIYDRALMQMDPNYKDRVTLTRKE
jgi:hypothetical protein